MLGTLDASRTNDFSLSWNNFHFNCLGYNVANLAFTAEKKIEMVRHIVLFLVQGKMRDAFTYVYTCNHDD